MNPIGDDIPKITTSNTKKEMIEAYNKLRKALEIQAQTELKPVKAKEERERREVVEAADALTTEKVIKAVNELKSETGKALTDIAAKLEEETERYNKMRRAIEIKEKELEELFEIERSAFALAALLEAQKQQKQVFENEMTRRKELLETEINQTRTDWETEKKRHGDALKEQKEQEEKRRRREQEEYQYSFEREKELKINQLTDQISKLDKELQGKREEFDKHTRDKESELKEREQAVAEREKLMDALQARVDGFPKELERELDKAVKEVTSKLSSEAAKNEQLLVRGFEGEKNVLQARIEALEQMVASQKKQIEKLTEQLDGAYGKVQDIAVKAVAGSSRQSAVPMSMKPLSNEQE
ncbi:MAG: hypothetical protein RBS57_09950 [Desulforhabdus sp.]|jgi:uncharacterized coiled-coil protein SlyX|nr:hypothetical protein [Desulforhabdus sp.]